MIGTRSAPMRLLLPLWICSLLATSLHGQQSATEPVQPTDYHSRTLYFLMADRFNPHAPYAPYVDPQHPFATNSVNCFVESCTEEEEFRRYWGGDIQESFRNLTTYRIWASPE